MEDTSVVGSRKSRASSLAAFIESGEVDETPPHRRQRSFSEDLPRGKVERDQDEAFQTVDKKKNDSVFSEQLQSATEKIQERREELESQMETLEREMERRAREAVQALVVSAVETDVKLEEDIIAKNALTPSQIALLYSTLKCPAMPFSKPRVIESPAASKRKAPRFAAAATKFPSERILMSTTSNQREVFLSHDNELYPHKQTSRVWKEKFWNKKAAIIQAAWRGMKAREILRKNLFAPPPLRPPPEILKRQHDEAELERVFRAPFREVEIEDTFSDSLDFADGDELRENLGIRERAQLSAFEQLFRRGLRKNEPLTIGRVVGMLRRSRSQVQKTSFDKLVDRMVKLLLKIKIDYYEPLPQGFFLNIAKESAELRKNLLRISCPGEVRKGGRVPESTNPVDVACIEKVFKSLGSSHPFLEEILWLLRENETTKEIRVKCRAFLGKTVSLSDWNEFVAKHCNEAQVHEIIAMGKSFSLKGKQGCKSSTVSERLMPKFSPGGSLKAAALQRQQADR